MKLAFLLGLLLVGLTSGAPTTSKDDQLVVNDEFFPDELKVYEGQHDIVKISIPLNKLNFNGDSSEENNDDVLLFFVEADVNDAEVVDQGLYVRKGNAVTKLLDHGRDIASPHDENSDVAYFAAKDGLYVYNSKENKAEKYGTINDDLIGVVIGNSTDDMYVLSADKKVYKISENGNSKEKIESIESAEQIVLDFSNNLFYVDSEMKVYVVKGAEEKKINSLPEYSKITLIRPPFIYNEGIPVVADKKVYMLHSNDTLEDVNITIDTEVSAYGPDATFIQYYGREKKIYGYNLLVLLLSTFLEQLREFLDGQKNEIRTISTRRSSQFRNNNKF